MVPPYHCAFLCLFLPLLYCSFFNFPAFISLALLLILGIPLIVFPPKFKGCKIPINFIDMKSFLNVFSMKTALVWAAVNPVFKEVAGTIRLCKNDCIILADGGGVASREAKQEWCQTMSLCVYSTAVVLVFVCLLSTYLHYLSNSLV